MTAIDYDQLKVEVAEKVRKLLAKAEDPGATSEEAQAFSAKAQQLMTRHAITLAMVQDSHKVDTLTEEKILVEGLWANRKTTLVGCIAKTNDCETVRWKAGSGKYRVSVVGFATDVEWVKTLYASLDTQLQTALNKSVKTEKPAGVHGRAWGAAFAAGFTSEIYRRLQSARREAIRAEKEERAAAASLAPGGAPVETLSDSVALVLVAKTEKVHEECKVRFPHVRTIQSAALSSRDGHTSGRTAGRNASLARGSVGGGFKGSLGR